MNSKGNTMATMDGNRMIPAKEIEGELWIKASDLYQARSAPVQVFDHVTAAWQGLRDAQNRSRLISNLINCGTCGYPLAPEERTSLIERDGVMVKPAPVQEPVAWLVEFENGEQELHFDKQSVGETQAPLYTASPAPVVPDVMTTAEGEHPEYVQGWNDCRQLMLQTRNNQHD